nr:ARID DNA-binding domain-containing protein [Tanacetum cinerariifolium]
MAAKTDMSNFARERKKDFKPNKLSVMLKYPKSIHFSTTYMIKRTDHANWDDIWFISNQTDKHLCYKLYSFCNIKEGFSVNKLENQMKFLFTYGIEGLGGYLSVYFSQEFNTIGEILGLSKGNGEEIKRCYINYLDVFTSYFKTERAPQQGYKDILEESTRKVEDKDRHCLIPHQWDFSEAGAPIAKSAVLKRKETLKHLGVKLEDTRDSQDQPILPHSTRNQNLQGILSRASTSKMTGNEDSSCRSYTIGGTSKQEALAKLVYAKTLRIVVRRAEDDITSKPPSNVPQAQWDMQVDYWLDPKHATRAAQKAQNQAWSTVFCWQGSRSLAILRDQQSSATREYPSLISTFFDTHSYDGVFTQDEARVQYVRGDVEVKGSRRQYADGCALHSGGYQGYGKKGQAAGAHFRGCRVLARKGKNAIFIDEPRGTYTDVKIDEIKEEGKLTRQELELLMMVVE